VKPRHVVNKFPSFPALSTGEEDIHILMLFNYFEAGKDILESGGGIWGKWLRTEESVLQHCDSPILDAR
jgi:hypothetical protein